MARLLRSYGVSKLGKPTAVDAAVVFDPVHVELAPRPQQQRYASHTHLSPPAVIAPSVTFRPIKVEFARTPQASHHTIGKVRPAAVIAPAVVYPPTRTRLAKPPPRVTTPPHSKLSPPAVILVEKQITASDTITFTESVTLTVILALPPPIRVELARRRPRPTAHPILRPPTVVSQGVVRLITGASNITFSESANLVTTRVLSATTTITFAESAAVVVTRPVSGATNIVFSENCSLTTTGAVVRMVMTPLPAIFRLMRKHPFA